MKIKLHFLFKLVNDVIFKKIFVKAILRILSSKLYSLDTDFL